VLGGLAILKLLFRKLLLIHPNLPSCPYTPIYRTMFAAYLPFTPIVNTYTKNADLSSETPYDPFGYDTNIYNTLNREMHDCGLLPNRLPLIF
jgi:hypothetical protein